jgi:hypothetical protein
VGWLIATAWADLNSPAPSNEWSIPVVASAASADIMLGYVEGQEYVVVWPTVRADLIAAARPRPDPKEWR